MILSIAATDKKLKALTQKVAALENRYERLVAKKVALSKPSKSLQFADLAFGDTFTWVVERGCGDVICRKIRTFIPGNPPQTNWIPTTGPSAHEAFVPTSAYTDTAGTEVLLTQKFKPTEFELNPKGL